MVEHQTSNLRVVGSSPTSDEFLFYPYFISHQYHFNSELILFPYILLSIPYYSYSWTVDVLSAANNLTKISIFPD